jgi:hypothetical protein
MMNTKSAVATIVGLLLLVSCAQQNHPVGQNNQDVLVDFSFERSYEAYLNRDSVLQTIPDTMGFLIDNMGDTTDLRLQEAILREHNEWLKYYKNPKVISKEEKGKNLVITVVFTGGGAYVFDGKAKATEDSLFLYYCDIGREDIPLKDTRYILTYTLKSKKAKSKVMSIVYQKPLPE